MKFSDKFFVRREDIDVQGHVNNVAFVRWIQDIAVAHWFSIANEAIRTKYTWVVLRHEIDYKNRRLRMRKLQQQLGLANRSASVGKGLRKYDAAKIY